MPDSPEAYLMKRVLQAIGWSPDSYEHQKQVMRHAEAMLAQAIRAAVLAEREQGCRGLREALMNIVNPPPAWTLHRPEDEVRVVMVDECLIQRR